MKEEWKLTLNKYQRDNLLWLLTLVLDGDLLGTNTGDWCGEIPFMIGDPKDHYRLGPSDRPNVSLEQYRKEHQSSESYRAARMELLNLAIANDSVRALMLTSSNPLLRDLAK